MSRRNEPMWHCYECNAEMRPMMMPDPHCASCHGTFVEMIESTEDDPRNFQTDPAPGPHHNHDQPNAYDQVDPMMRLFQTFLGGTLLTGDGNVAQPPNRRRGSDPTSSANPDSEGRSIPPRANTLAETLGQGGNGGSGSSTSSRTMRFNFGGGQMGVTYGYSSSTASRETSSRTTVTRGEDIDPVVPMGDFLQLMFPPRPQRTQGNRENNEGGGGGAGAGAGAGGGSPLFLEYLAQLFGGVPMFVGGEGGLPRQLGDYALTSEALDAIITQLMENNPNNHRPVPAPEDMVRSLPRSKVSRGSELLTKDCAVCKDEFEVNQEVINLPCKHAFHDECILPWLETSGTCPVCRYQLVPQPAAHGVPPPGPRPSAGNGGPDRSQSPRDHTHPADQGPRHLPGAWSELD